MSSPPSKIRLREAREEDIPIVVPMLINTFRGRPMSEAFFPERLRVRQDDADQIAFRSERIRKRFAARDKAKSGQGPGSSTSSTSQQYHYIVAVLEDTGGDETIVGYAEWVDNRAVVSSTTDDNSDEESSLTTQAEELAGRKERKARLEAETAARSMPSSLDREAVDTAYKEIAVLKNFLREALGEEGFANSWSLDAIGVDPAHQRKGIGKMLMQYGAARAEKDGKNIRFMASASGAKMYQALGYEEVGSREILGGMEYAFVQRASK